ncbi:MAG: hypothetical protein ICV63_08805 [Coleofasciculus sp. Co-bin14]|nr:hypothetical protein [Coleofasciculus sp. Co-bin14]
MSEIDRIWVKDLEKRYGIGKTALYTRLESLQIKPIKDGKRSYVSGEQLTELDKLDEHLRSGGVLPSLRQASSELLELDSSPNTSTEFTLRLPEITSLSSTLEKLAEKLKSDQVDDTEPYRNLFYFANNNIRVPSSLVRKLTGKQPKGECCYWGSFKFIKVTQDNSPEDNGKIGRERAWWVRKRDN